jgi:hypothetical protein
MMANRKRQQSVMLQSPQFNDDMGDDNFEPPVPAAATPQSFEQAAAAQRAATLQNGAAAPLQAAFDAQRQGKHITRESQFAQTIRFFFLPDLLCCVLLSVATAAAGGLPPLLSAGSEVSAHSRVFLCLCCAFCLFRWCLAFGFSRTHMFACFASVGRHWNRCSFRPV